MYPNSQILLFPLVNHLPPNRLLNKFPLCLGTGMFLHVIALAEFRRSDSSHNLNDNTILLDRAYVELIPFLDASEAKHLAGNVQAIPHSNVPLSVTPRDLFTALRPPAIPYSFDVVAHT